MATDLELAVLALDAYNRGGQGLNLTESSLGEFTVGAARDAGPFYAQAYTRSGETVISYRGTNNALDVPAWFGSVGEDTFQAQQAADFYQEVTGGIAADPNVTLTGHSLGGGLAGLVGTLYGARALIFDNMGFEQTALRTWFRASFESDIRDVYYGTNPIPNNNNSNVDTIAVSGEVLAPFRLLQDADARTLDTHGSDLGPLDRHSQSVLIVLLWAETKGNEDWHEISDVFFEAFFNEDIANAAGAQRISDYNGALYEMQSSIAYTALDHANGPFGNTALKALFNDIDAIGRLYENGVGNTLLDTEDVKEGLVEIAVQYAADLAAQRSTNQESSTGIITISSGDGLLYVDLDPTKWIETTEQGQFNVVGLEKLVNSIFTDAEVPVNEWHGSINDVTRVVAATADSPAHINGTDTPDSLFSSGSGIFVGGSGNDQIQGGDGDDVLIGGDGNDLLRGGEGSDVLVGGDGNDTFIMDGGEDGSVDYFLGGDGADRFILASMSFGDLQEYVVTEAEAQDRLFLLYDFMGLTYPATASYETSQLLPLLGGIGNQYGVNTFAQLGSDVNDGAFFEWRLSTGGDDPYITEPYQFHGAIWYTREGADLIITIMQGAYEQVSNPGWPPDVPPFTETIHYFVGDSETRIRVEDFTDGDLGIYFYDWGEADGGYWDYTPEMSAGVTAISASGALYSPVGEFQDASSAIPSDNAGADADGNPNSSITPLNGTTGNDILTGTSSHDVLYGLAGDDELFGADGDDYIAPGAGVDQVDGGNGSDIVSYEGAASATNVNLTTGAASDGDTLVSIEHIVATSYSDILTGNSTSNTIWGREGNDTISGNSGHDSLYGEDGDDLIDGGAGNDVIDGGDGQDTAIFSGDRSDYQISRLSGGGLSVRDLRSNSPDGTDDLTNVELLQFADGTITEFAAANHAPTPGSPGLSTADKDTPITIAATILLADATDADGDTLTILSLGAAQNGAVAFDVNGDVVFTPATGFTGYATFTYTLSDGNGGTTIATRYVSVETDNEAPVAVDDSGLSTALGTPLTVLAATLLANDTDADGDTKTIVEINNAIGGTIAFNGTGDIVFTPANGFAGTASFDYIVSDGNGGYDIARVSIAVSAVGQTITGTNGNDTLTGTSGNDTISGLNGADILDGLAGNDLLNGGDGSDELNGGDGDDILIGGAGADILDGGLGLDVASYETASSAVYVHMLDEAQNTGDATGDTYTDIENLRGSAFNDTLIATDENNSVWGGEGNDVLLGLLGNDTLYGEDGADELHGGEGNDHLIGGAGNDELFGDEGNDTLDGGEGDDYFVASSGNDILIGGTGEDELHGGDDNDQISGGAGEDLLYGDDGDDVLDGGADDDFLSGGNGSDTFVFKAGYGSDFIADFTLGLGGDVIELSGFGISSFTALQSVMEEWGGNTFLNFGDGSELILQDVANSQLSSDDFRFV